MKRREAMNRVANLMVVTPALALGTQANSAVAVGVIGTGNRGRYDTNFFTKDPRARVVALCDLYADQIDRAKTQVPAVNDARTFTNYKDLLAWPGVDAVLITTPVYLHPEHFEAAVAAGKHIYCEKPAGADVGGVKRLMEAAKRSPANKHVQFGFQQRFSPEYLAAEKIVRSAQFGGMGLMRSHWMVGGVPAASAKQRQIPAEMEARMWYPWRAKSGDMIVEQDCHGVDVMNWFSGRHPVSATGDGGRKVRKYGDTMDHLNVTYDYGEGLRGFLHACQLAQGWGLVDEQFFGTESTMETHRKYYRWSRPGQEAVKVDSKREITIDAIEHFLAAIVNNKPENHAADAADSTLTSLLGRLAIDRGTRVTWEELLKSA